MGMKDSYLLHCTFGSFLCVSQWWQPAVTKRYTITIGKWNNFEPWLVEVIMKFPNLVQLHVKIISISMLNSTWNQKRKIYSEKPVNMGAGPGHLEYSKQQWPFHEGQSSPPLFDQVCPINESLHQVSRWENNCHPKDWTVCKLLPHHFPVLKLKKLKKK